jgi:hypothetical protein
MWNKLHNLTLLTTVVCLSPLQAQTQATTPSMAVEMFFKATADSNIKAMGMLFGDTKGPVAVTKSLPKWEEHLIVMNTFFSGVTVKALGESDSKSATQRTVTTQLSRGNCKVTISVVTAKAPQGWLVKEFDMVQAGQVNRVCQ